MESSKLGNLIRIGNSEILSCTLTGVDKENKDLKFVDVYFRDAVEKECGILFYQFNNNYYYPISMEFRLIDNNILHLIEELNINSFDRLCLFLESSFKREEGREVAFFPIVLKLDETPKFSIKLSDFTIENENDIVWLINE